MKLALVSSLTGGCVALTMLADTARAGDVSTAEAFPIPWQAQASVQRTLGALARNARELFRFSELLLGEWGAYSVAVIFAPPDSINVERNEDDLGPFQLVGRFVEGNKEGVWVELRGPNDRIAATHDYRRDSRNGLVVLWESMEKRPPSPNAIDATASIRPRSIKEYKHGKLHGLAWRLATDGDRGVVLRFVNGRIDPDDGNISDAPERPEEEAEKELRQGAQRHLEAARRIIATARQGLLDKSH